MSNLVNYASSDEEIEDIESERPAKIARTERTGPEPPHQLTDVKSPALPIPNAQTEPLPSQQHEQPDAPPPGPSTPPPVLEATGPIASAPVPESPLQSPYTTERQRLRDLTMPTVPNFSIPDSPPPPETNSEAAAALTARTRKFERFLELKKKGVHFNARLQTSASLKNPSLLPKLMAFAGISQADSYTSTLPEGLGAKTDWPEEWYIEGLMKRNERAEKKRIAERDKVEFVAAKTRSIPDTSGEVLPLQRKSRFDQ
ncbi:Hypothetical protein R9X50_00649900 [Acrodontium crateriforme]|uniref:Uncharacterized protein n=1 Tax=Acrodontium crateriforme TaxID=150365 RepID=A0AAQ3RBL2_9PEZI|nr:Hypothetical protein R9X50_00649900 [Acrodontium crateriforme]